MSTRNGRHLRRARFPRPGSIDRRCERRPWPGPLALAILALLGTVGAPSRAIAQTGDGRADTSASARAARRFAFAETYLGVDGYRAGAAELPVGANGGIASDATLVPRLTIGGLHFWGHADFHVSFALGARVRGRLDDGTAPDAALRPGIETGARVFPFALRADGVPRPFVGIGWQRVDVAGRSAAGDGPALTLVRFPIQAGLALRTGRTTFQAGVHLHTDRDFRYATAPGRLGDGRLPGSAVWLGMTRLFDATRSAGPVVASGAEAVRERRLRAAGRLAGPSVAIGASTATAIGASSWNRDARSELGARLPGTVFPEVAAGWEWPDQRMAISVVARRWELDQDAFGLMQRQSRASVAVEALRFLGDWHGFVPFIGASLGRDHLRVRETFATVTDAAGRTPAVARGDSRWIPGVVVGWDIQPTRTQSIVLRTNLRYAPTASLAMPDGRASSFAHLEFNFIQVVWHPRR